MKKRIMTVLTAGFCVAMCVSAFTLPNRANNSLRKAQGIVLEREVPGEYMADFVSASNDLSADDKTITLTVDQQQELVETIRSRCMEEFDITIPEGLEFEFEASLVPLYDWTTNSMTDTVFVSMNAKGEGNLLYYANLSIPGFPEDITPVHLNSRLGVVGINSVNYQEVFGIAGQSAVQDFTVVARQKFKEVFGIDIPEDFVFGYAIVVPQIYGTEGESSIRFNVTDNQDIQQMSFSAGFSTSTISDFLNKQGNLIDFRAGRINDSTLIEIYSKTALEALYNELGHTVPDYYTLDMNYIAQAEDQENLELNARLELLWSDADAEHDKGIEGFMISSKEKFNVIFDKLDLTEHTGRIVGVQMFVDWNGFSIREEHESPGFVRLTEEQMNEMLEAAKNFLNDKGIGFGELYNSTQLTMEGKPVIEFRFSKSDDINDMYTLFGTVIITITQDLRVMGYRY